MEAEASYRIQTVARLTGVPAATLRAWERRYGFPSPARTAAAYRLFSEADIALVKEMRTLVQRGVAPNEAARSLLANLPGAEALESDPYEQAIARMVAAIERFELDDLQLELQRALMLGNGPVVFTKVLDPVLRKVGELWQAGAISVAHEHLASHMIGTTLLDLLRTTCTAPGAPTALLACFAEETHVLPLYGAGLAMSSWGYRPLMLGARTPPSALARAVETLSPAVVGLSVTVAPEPKSAARDLVDAYADACGSVPFVVGGAGAPALSKWIEKRGGLIVPADWPSARKVVDAASRRRTRR